MIVIKKYSSFNSQKIVPNQLKQKNLLIGLISIHIFQIDFFVKMEM